MDMSIFRHTRPLLAVLMLALLLAGCSDNHSPTAPGEQTQDLSQLDDGRRSDDGALPPTIAPGEPNPATPVTSVEGLVAQLQSLGIDASYQGQSLETSFFLPAPHIVRIHGEDVRVFLYDTVEALKQDAGQVSPDGGTLGTVSVRWVAPPHFYARSIYLALYVGSDEKITNALASTFGPPFAGEGATEPPSQIDPDGDGSYRMEKPSLVVAATSEELERLTQYLPDDGLDVNPDAVDFSGNIVVAVFRGAMPTAGYGIEIETVRVDADGSVVVEVSLTNPGADELVAQVITHPVDVKVLPREDLTVPGDATWSVQTADGGLLVRLGDTPLPSDPLPTEPDEPFRLADVRGTIITAELVDAGDSDILARILVEGPGADDTVYDTAWVEVVRSTAVSFDGESFAPPTLADLAPGRRVQVSFVGPVRESFPVQAIAGQVVIFR